MISAFSSAISLSRLVAAGFSTPEPFKVSIVWSRFVFVIFSSKGSMRAIIQLVKVRTAVFRK